jgi:hypothetical protein
MRPPIGAACDRAFLDPWTILSSKDLTAMEGVTLRWIILVTLLCFVRGWMIMENMICERCLATTRDVASRGICFPTRTSGYFKSYRLFDRLLCTTSILNMYFLRFVVVVVVVVVVFGNKQMAPWNPIPMPKRAHTANTGFRIGNVVVAAAFISKTGSGHVLAISIGKSGSKKDKERRRGQEPSHGREKVFHYLSAHIAINK